MTNIGRARAIELEENWIWSVQLEANFWADDTFTGTFEECLEYVKKYDYKLDKKEAQIALIELDENGCFDFCRAVFIDDEYADESDRMDNFEHYQF